MLQGDTQARDAILNSALKQFPIIGPKLGHGSHSLHGSGIGLMIGIVGSVLSGLGITMAAQNAFNTVYAVPFKGRPNFLSSRVRGLKLLIVFGLLQVVSTVVTGLVAGGFGGVLLFVAGVLVGLVLNLVLFFAVFRLLTDDSISTGELRPGIVMAAVLWELVQLLGGVYIGHVLKGANQTYGIFGTVIGLLVWLYLGARVVVYSAEINTVLTRGLWPRSILDPPTPADRRVRAALAKVPGTRRQADRRHHLPPRSQGVRRPGQPGVRRGALAGPRRARGLRPAARRRRGSGRSALTRRASVGLLSRAQARGVRTTGREPTGGWSAAATSTVRPRRGTRRRPRGAGCW